MTEDLRHMYIPPEGSEQRARVEAWMSTHRIERYQTYVKNQEIIFLNDTYGSESNDSTIVFVFCIVFVGLFAVGFPIWFKILGAIVLAGGAFLYIPYLKKGTSFNRRGQLHGSGTMKL